MNCLFSSEVTEPRSSCGKNCCLVPEIPVGKTEVSETKADHSLMWTRGHFLRGIKECVQISKTGPARSTGLIRRSPQNTSYHKLISLILLQMEASCYRLCNPGKFCVKLLLHFPIYISAIWIKKKKCNRRALKSSTVFELRRQLLRQIRSLWGQTELHNTPCSRFHLREKNVFSEELYWK